MSEHTQAPPLGWPHYGIGFVAAVKRGFSKYADFSGRASRGEFWWWYLFYVLVVVVLSGLTGALAAATTQPGSDEIPTGAIIGLILLGVFLLAIAVPSLALGARRLHDGGFSALFLLLILVSSFGGGIVLLVLWILPTSPKAVRYGPPDAPAGAGHPGAYGAEQGYGNPGYGAPQGYPGQPYGAEGFGTQGYGTQPDPGWSGNAATPHPYRPPAS